jgi:hypothetical protein
MQHVTKVTGVEMFAGADVVNVGARWQCACGQAAEFVIGQVVNGDRIESVGRAISLAHAAAFVHVRAGD